MQRSARQPPQPPSCRRCLPSLSTPPHSLHPMTAPAPSPARLQVYRQAVEAERRDQRLEKYRGAYVAGDAQTDPAARLRERRFDYASLNEHLLLLSLTRAVRTRNPGHFPALTPSPCMPLRDSYFALALSLARTSPPHPRPCHRPRHRSRPPPSPCSVSSQPHPGRPPTAEDARVAPRPPHFPGLATQL